MVLSLAVMTPRLLADSIRAVEGERLPECHGLPLLGLLSFQLRLGSTNHPVVHASEVPIILVGFGVRCGDGRVASAGERVHLSRPLVVVDVRDFVVGPRRQMPFGFGGIRHVAADAGWSIHIKSLHSIFVGYSLPPVAVYNHPCWVGARRLVMITLGRSQVTTVHGIHRQRRFRPLEVPPGSGGVSCTCIRWRSPRR